MSSSDPLANVRKWTFDAEPGDEWTPDDQFIRIEDVRRALGAIHALSTEMEFTDVGEGRGEFERGWDFAVRTMRRKIRNQLELGVIEP